MARTIAQIQESILQDIAADADLQELNSSSSTALYRLFVRVVAKAIATLEALFDFYRADLTADLARQKAHTLQWYRNKALSFELGAELVEGTDVYPPRDPAEAEAARIIRYAAVVEEGVSLVVKVNKDNGGAVPLSLPEFAAFAAYMRDIKDAGVGLTVRNVNPDQLKISIDIYYDQVVLSPQGARLDGQANAPVVDAVSSFLAAVPFNGRFVTSALVDALQLVDGVVVPVIRTCQAARFDSSSFTSVDVDYDPFAGFLRIYSPDDLVINYLPYV